MKTLFKQAYETRFKVGEGAYIVCKLVLENEPLKNEEEIQKLAVAKLNEIYFAFDVILRESTFEIVNTMTIEDKDDPNYLVAHWLSEDGRESEFMNWDCFTDGISGAEIDESLADYDDIKEKLKIIEFIEAL